MSSNSAFLNINSSAVAFQDQVLTSNPLLRSFDWNRRLNGLQVYSPEARTFVCPPRQMVTLFDTSRGTTIDSTTTFGVSYLADGRYRFAWTGGSNPTLATDQAMTFTATDMTVYVAANKIVTITAASGSPFSQLTAGGVLYINGPYDVVAPSFNVLNSGYWTIVSATSTVLTLVRPTGTNFEGQSEVVTGVTAANDMIAFVPSVVQVGDKMKIASKFSIETRQTYSIEEVTSKWVKVSSANPIPEESGIVLNTTAMTFYYAKRFTRVEVNQRANVYYNGANDSVQELEPWVAGDSAQMAWQERVGPVWKLSVFNLSQVPMNINVFACE